MRASVLPVRTSLYAALHIVQGYLLHFEEFVISGTTKIQKTEKKQDNEAEKETLSGRFRGLCATCDNADDCSFPKDDAGVWHCEEYR